ncbi:MAG: spermidine synthase [Planctomycetaceae bacterium]
MKPTIERGRATTPDGRSLTLHEHDGDFLIRVDGVGLMSTRQHHSEERLAELACAGLRDVPAARVLIGGLGMGFTLRAALEALGPGARVTVAEVMPAVIAWNRDPGFGGGAAALDDPRVEVLTADVADVLVRRGRWHAIILDVDNGADGLTLAANDRLYAPAGLEAARAALVPGGCLAVWSATDDPEFGRRLERSGFGVAIERSPVHRGGGGRACLFLGRRA